MMLIVMSGILISATAGTILVYEVVKQQVLATEIANLETITKKFNNIAVQRFSASEQKLKGLARLLENRLQQPIQKGEVEMFHRLFERNDDGVFRNRRQMFNGKFEASSFLPPESIGTDAEKIEYLRIKQVLDIFGASAKQRMENVWYLSPTRGEIIFDRNFPNFAFEQNANNDYTKTPWVTYSTPQINPYRELRFTPPLFDPVPQIWMVSAVYPLYVNDKWVGCLGEDMPLTDTLDFMFQGGILYPASELFLLDDEGNFVLAGAWQKELENSKEHFKPNLKNEPQFAELLTKTLTHQTILLTDNLTFHNKQYIVIGALIESINWRFYKLVPVNEMIAPTQKLFLTILEMIFCIGLVNGLLIFTMTGRTITRRVQILTDSMSEYAKNRSVRVAEKLAGNDEISQVALAFDQLANDIEIREIELQESRDQFAMSDRMLAIRNTELMQFTNIAAHHLQEPTRRIVSFVQNLENELAEEVKKNEAIATSLQFIGQSAKRQRALVRDIQLYLAATESRGEVEAINVELLINRILAKYTQKIHEMQASIEFGELPTIVMDKLRLLDIFSVLIENALLYPRANVRLKIKIWGEIQGNSVHYWIQDNGIGIPTEYRERVFLVFERLQVNKNQDSTGIGLSILKRIIESCNGTVSLSETLNGGVTVEFELPLSG
jgi:signal transduction histidine kinase